MPGKRRSSPLSSWRLLSVFFCSFSCLLFFLSLANILPRGNVQTHPVSTYQDAASVHVPKSLVSLDAASGLLRDDAADFNPHASGGRPCPIPYVPDPSGGEVLHVDTPGGCITLQKGVHFWAQHIPPRHLVQDLSELYEGIPKSHLKFVYPQSTPEWPFAILSHEPVILYFPRIMSDEECDAYVEYARSNLQRSYVVPHAASGSMSLEQDVRTSHQTWLADSTNEITRRVSARLHKVIGIANSEATQILRYQKGQKYSAHHDYFAPNLYGAQPTNRAVTFFLYLNTVPRGGAGDTYFPRAFGGLPRTDWDNCSAGLRVFPRKGAGAVFFDQLPDGRLDPHSLHGSCAIALDGAEKWGGTKWFRTDTGDLQGSNAVAGV